MMVGCMLRERAYVVLLISHNRARVRVRVQCAKSANMHARLSVGEDGAARCGINWHVNDSCVVTLNILHITHSTLYYAI